MPLSSPDRYEHSQICQMSMHQLERGGKSLTWSLLTERAGVIFSLQQKLCLVLVKFLSQVSTQRIGWLWLVHQHYQCVDHCETGSGKSETTQLMSSKLGELAGKP